MLTLHGIIAALEVGRQTGGIDGDFNARLRGIVFVDVESDVGFTEVAMHEAEAEVADDEADARVGRVVEPWHVGASVQR